MSTLFHFYKNVKTAKTWAWECACSPSPGEVEMGTSLGLSAKSASPTCWATGQGETLFLKPRLTWSRNDSPSVIWPSYAYANTHEGGYRKRRGENRIHIQYVSPVPYSVYMYLSLCVLSLTLNSGLWKKWPVSSSTEDVIEAEKGRLTTVSNICMYICVYILSQLCVCACTGLWKPGVDLGFLYLLR